MKRSIKDMLNELADTTMGPADIRRLIGSNYDASEMDELTQRYFLKREIATKTPIDCLQIAILEMVNEDRSALILELP